MTTVNIPKKTHKKLKAEAARKGMDLQDLVAQKLSTIVMIGMITIGLLGLGYAYADHPLPRYDYDQHLCYATFESEFAIYSCNWLYINEKFANVTDTVYIDQETDEPVNEFMVRLKEQMSILTKPIPEPKEEMTFSFINPEIIAKLEEKKQAILDRYDEVKEFCSYGVGAYHAIQVKEQFETLKQLLQTVASDDYVGKELNKKYEACRIMKAYKGMISQYIGLPSVEEGSELGPQTDTTDSPLTDPVTSRDIKDAVDDAYEVLCTSVVYGNATKALYGCDIDIPEGEGGATPGAACQQAGQPAEIGSLAEKICPLQKKLQWIKDNPTVDTDLLALETLCQIFNASYGAVDESFQPLILRDGTCDEFLEEKE